MRARLSPQPDDAVPRFDYESHVAALVTERAWPDSTRQISELRLVIEYQSRTGAMRELVVDMVDYPGEWLLDLPLLATSFEAWSAASLTLSREEPRARLAAPWHAHLATLDAQAAADETAAIAAARLFTDYLAACRNERYALSLLPPGRFLMPADLAGSPALTFAPLDLPGEGEPAEGSLWAMMRRRFEAYKDVAVRPFFRDHFARLDRQIVLVDALAALNAGPAAVRDLEAAFKSLLDCFEIGRRTFMSALLRPRADRILFAATKADHLHHASHDRLEALLRRMVDRSISRAEVAGAAADVIALAANVGNPRGGAAARRQKPCTAFSGFRRRAKRRGDKSSTARPRSRSIRANCPTIRMRCSNPVRRRFAASPRQARKRAISVSCGFGRPRSNRAMTECRRFPISVLTGHCSSSSETGSNDTQTRRLPHRRSGPRDGARPTAPRRGAPHHAGDPDRRAGNRPRGRAGRAAAALGGVVLGIGRGPRPARHRIGRRQPDRGPVEPGRLARHGLGAAMAAVATVAALAIMVREGLGLARLAAIDTMRARAAAVLANDDRSTGRALGRDLIALTRRMPRLARARARLQSHLGDIIDGGDLVRLAERELMAPLDEEARRLVSAAAKRVSVVTAVSPRALAVDMFFVLLTALGLVRRLALLYGGRPGALGLFKLVRHVVSHLAVTGGMAVSDGLIQQVIGHGLAAKLSARLGEGVLNGLLTARLGLAAIEATRPLPFTALRQPALNDLAGSLLRGAEKAGGEETLADQRLT